MVQEALEVQIATENERVEERAQELAAAKLQAVMRGKHDRKIAMEKRESRDALEKQGVHVHRGSTYQTTPSGDSLRKPSPRGPPPEGAPPGRNMSIQAEKV